MNVVEDITVGVTRPGGAGLPMMVTTRTGPRPGDGLRPVALAAVRVKLVV